VLSLIILLAGGLALLTLPISQYPEIVPPTVQVTARYQGADPKVIADTVATPIEQEVNGVQDMLYMSSQSTGDGTMTLDVTRSQKFRESILPATRLGFLTKQRSESFFVIY
jgi:multidrug efflux pump